MTDFQSPSLRGSGRFGPARRAPVARLELSIPFIAGQWSLRISPPSREGGGRRLSIPFIAGQWSLRIPPGSPSFPCLLSIPFIAGQWSLRGARAAGPGARKAFNPLHCGAVVASSLRRPGSAPHRDLSIPFIAGQWSLHTEASVHQTVQSRLSIPFIAGQWSLQDLRGDIQGCAVIFQSPSLRGSGRFSRARSASRFGFLFQSPSLRGSGRFNRWRRRRCAPFAAFQSPSLRGSGRFWKSCGSRQRRSSPFNPLHCGAVVASGALRKALPAMEPAFNPLHCGAVVASAGSWLVDVLGNKGFNPLHCGAVVASFCVTQLLRLARSRFNPLHCGAVVASFSLLL